MEKTGWFEAKSKSRLKEKVKSLSSSKIQNDKKIV
jgi:hypothetical protein